MTMQDEIAAALASLRADQGEQLLYRRVRTGQACIECLVTGLRGSTLFRTINERGMTIVSRSTDFLIGVEDLAGLPGGLPQEGDQVARTVGTRQQIYEVVRFNNEPCWRWSDSGETQFRIHTKLLRAESPLTP